MDDATATALRTQLRDAASEAWRLRCQAEENSAAEAMHLGRYHAFHDAIRMLDDVQPASTTERELLAETEEALRDRTERLLEVERLARGAKEIR